MKRHSFDPLSFVFGIMFLAMAAAAAWKDELSWSIDEWILPAAVLMAGVGLLASAIRMTVARNGDPEPTDNR